MLFSLILEVYANNNPDAAKHLVKQLTDKELLEFNKILNNLSEISFKTFIDRLK